MIVELTLDMVPS